MFKIISQLFTVPVMITIAVLIIIFYFLIKREVINTAENIGSAINPLSNENIFYRAAGSLMSVFTGDDSSLGSQVYDLFNPPVYESPSHKGVK